MLAAVSDLLLYLDILVLTSGFSGKGDTSTLLEADQSISDTQLCVTKKNPLMRDKDFVSEERVGVLSDWRSK